MAPPTFEKLRSRYPQFWFDMVVDSGRVKSLDAIARKLLVSKARYQKVESQLGVPWWFIAILHNRESSGNFAGVLHNGEHIIGTGRKTRLVPAGRGPFSSWEEAATDALKMKNLHKIADWSIERVCYEGERFNGFGYYSRGVPSAYLWSFSNIYKGGKYVADGVWSSTARDQQAGIMPLLKRMMVADSTIKFGSSQVAPEIGASPVRGDAEIWNVQRRLKAMNYSPGGLDGLWGGMTAGAISGFLNDRGAAIAAPTSYDDFRKIVGALKAELSKAESERFTRPIAPERAEATAAELAPKLPEVQAAQTAERLGFWGSIIAGFTTATTAVGNYISENVQWISSVKDFVIGLPWPIWFGFGIGLTVLAYMISRKSGDAKNEATKAYQEGSRT